MWQLWFKFQCVAVGYPPKWLRDIERKNTEEWKRRRTGWHQVENRLNEIQDRDLIVVALPGRRIGRLGEVIEKRVLDDQWKPLVPRSPEEDEGLLGRRILVRWELENGSDSSDMVVQLPEDFYLNPGEWRQPLARIHDKSAIEKFRKIMADPTNWVGLLGHFGYEQALSDYIALHPHRLEGGLLPHPNKRIREKVFKDRSRADVLLLDKESKPVIVECKQESPPSRIFTSCNITSNGFGVRRDSRRAEFLFMEEHKRSTGKLHLKLKSLPPWKSFNISWMSTLHHRADSPAANTRTGRKA